MAPSLTPGETSDALEPSQLPARTGVRHPATWDLKSLGHLGQGSVQLFGM